jgi:prepilin-type N-terminal cleavage/methylation domain-containing protein
MSKSTRRRAFTLPEVLVTVTIVAVLAAVVVPAVLNQVSKGDTAGLAGDVGALRTAITSFTTDTRHYPRTIQDLIRVPDKDSLDLMGTAYGATAVNAWKGPYFPTSQSVTSATDYTLTAYGLTLDNDFEAPGPGNGNFITLVFNTAPTANNIATIDRLFDSGTGTVPAASCSGSGTGSTTGQITWTETAGSTTCAISSVKWRLVSASQ